ncbi:hypothetical protein [Pasteuria penetrans]|uniref:hypothetical protein n=1 Tax=Pasteuria penetrans TaxID=86005 RepID=UPI00165C50FD|nr:hypothetical protein [Pasteuria penetrans]
MLHCIRSILFTGSTKTTKIRNVVNITDRAEPYSLTINKAIRSTNKARLHYLQ